MLAHAEIYGTALAGVVATLALWGWLARAMKALGKSRWRPVMLCLPLMLAAAVYGLFWYAFFLSPGAAVQLHAVRLTIEHAVSGFGTAIIAAWLGLSLILLLPLFHRKA
jgi:peptidoglycan biosynthesis protein MviN/MurJ (putative lipid II flippase)